MAFLRGGDLVHNNAALNAGSATNYTTPGPDSNVVVFIVSDTSTTLAIQVATKGDGTISAGRNADLSGATWCNYMGADAIAVVAGTPIAVDLSPFAPQFLRVLNKTGGTNIAHLTVIVESLG